MSLHVKELRNATEDEIDSIIKPGLCFMAQARRAMKKCRIATLAAGLLVAAVVILLAFYALNLNTVGCLLVSLPVLVIFGLSLYRTDYSIDRYDYMIDTINRNKFLVKQVKTQLEGVDVILAYVRHPRSHKHAMYAFGSASWDKIRYGFYDADNVRDAIQDILNQYHAGTIEMIEQ